MNKLTNSLLVALASSIFTLALVMVAAWPTTQAATIKPFPVRQFYQTSGRFDGAHAPTACTAGYHMASLWEILDVSNLGYNTTLGLTADDSGSGPPSVSDGWIRTGFAAESSATNAGLANCNAWTENAGNSNGTFANLNNVW